VEGDKTSENCGRFFREYVFSLRTLTALSPRTFMITL